MHFSVGDVYDFGTVVFTEQDIIDYAKKNDPLEFHTDKEIAQAHMFKELVASGQHAFHHFYVNHWIPSFGKTVLCGLSVNNWSFHKPIYPEIPVHCIVRIESLHHHVEKNSVSIKWKFEFLNSKGIHFQQLEMNVLHRIQPDN